MLRDFFFIFPNSRFISGVFIFALLTKGLAFAQEPPRTRPMEMISLQSNATGTDDEKALTIFAHSDSIRRQQISALSEIIISPNPNNGVFKVEMRSFSGNISIKLVGALGEIMYEQNLENMESLVNAILIPKGLYHCIVTRNSSVIGSKKLVIQ